MPDFISETKQMFAGQSVQPRDAQIQQMIEKNRSNNFEFKDPGLATDPSLHTSVAHSHFDYKGKAMEIRQVLNPEVKKDLRQHHFTYGNHPVEYKTSALRASGSLPSGILKPPMGPQHKPDSQVTSGHLKH
jgi:hypothetical protein